MNFNPPDNNKGGSPRKLGSPESFVDRDLLRPRTLKETARRVMASDRRNTTVVTFCYLLLASWLPTLYFLFLSNPVSDALDALYVGFYDLSEQMAQLSDETIVNLYGQVLSGAWSALREGLASGWGLFSTFLLILILLIGVLVDYGFKSWSLRRLQGEFVGPEVLLQVVDLAGKILLLTLLVLGTVFLWGWLLAPLALYMWYRLRIAAYLMLDCPDMSAWQAYCISPTILRGHKWQLLKLDVSFFGWLFLAEAVSYGVSFLSGNYYVYNLLALIGGAVVYLYVEPYRNLSYAGFFLELKNGSPQLHELEEALAERRRQREE
ncbi:MAG: DUF975 family protein [Clostridiales bacterium]|nr:DUF975 family protein [Clostridiales bacterium]